MLKPLGKELMYIFVFIIPSFFLMLKFFFLGFILLIFMFLFRFFLYLKTVFFVKLKSLMQA